MLERTFLSDGERRSRLRRRIARGLLLGAIGAVLVLLDRPLYHAFANPDSIDTDAHQALRQLGYLPTWLVVGLLFWLADRADRPKLRGLAVEPSWPPRPAHHRAGLIVLSAVLAGLAAEILKLLTRRLRPNAEDGLFVFRSFFDDPFSSSGIGLPSSHTAVAFGGAVMVALLVPAVRVPVLLLAAGCGVTRMMAGAHFASDVYIGALVAAWVACSLYRAGQGPRRGPAGGLVQAGRVH